MIKNATNKLLHKAKKSKSDEFYTQYIDIQKEIEVYLEYNPDVFRGKVVYCNCDDPFKSNFFRYFILNFKRIGLKQFITSYKSLSANKFIINSVGDIDENDEFNLKDVIFQLKQNKQNEWIWLKGDGDFRSDESITLLKQADYVITNPPFSLFREYFKQLIDYDKKFLIMGNLNAISYKEFFPLIKNNILWLGPSISNGGREFQVPDEYPINATGWRIDENGNKFLRVKGVRWFTNLDHGKRHKPLSLMTMRDNIKFSKHKEVKGKEYSQYDNYKAIEVPFTNAIPSDYDGVMGVPITFLDKYNSDQFEIIKFRKGDDEKDLSINGKCLYFRILIKNKQIQTKSME